VSSIETKYDLSKVGKLEHEIQFLRERVVNLEVFKQNFFLNHAELIKTHEKLAQLEQQFSLSKIKESIVGLSDETDNNVSENDKLDEDLIGFFKKNISAEEYKAVVASVFYSVEGIGVDAAVQIILHDKILNYALDESSKEENIQVINQHKKQGDVVEVDDYIVFNFPHVSLLVRQLPVNEVEKNKKIKNFLYIVSIGANSRIDEIYKDFELELLKKNIYKIFKKTQSSFELMQDNIDSQIVSISELFLKFESELAENINTMGLPDSNIKTIRKQLQDAKTELNLLLTSGLTLDTDFINTIIKLEQAYSKHFSILK